MSNRIYSHPNTIHASGSLRPIAGLSDTDRRYFVAPDLDPDEPKFQRITTPSGLTLEVLPPRPRSLLPLATTTVLIWSAIGAGVWWLWSN